MTFDTDTGHGTQDRQPETFMGLPKLMHMAVSGVDLMPMGQHLLQRAEADPDDANALMDLAILMQLTGNAELGLSIQRDALQKQQLYHSPNAAGPDAIQLLALMAPGELMVNTPLEFLVQNTRISLHMLYVGAGVPAPTQLPPHDLLFVAVAESAENRPLLLELEPIVAAWPRPVLNRPARIADLTRDGVSRMLDGIPGVVMPMPARVQRGRLEAVGRGELSMGAILDDGDYPVIARPIGSQAGRGLAKLDGPQDVPGYLTTQADDEFYLARFVDYSSRDSLFRKYRIVFIEGRPFAAHMAISEQWKIHYLNAGMADSESKRAEEARFMAEFDEGFAGRHQSALASLVERTGLDYFGIDCAETADGQLLIFELDSALVVHAMDPVETFPYKQPQMRKVFDAFRDMLVRRAGRAPA